MSDKENLRRRIARAVFIKAWKMYKKGGRLLYSFGTSLKVAWQIIRGKLFVMHTKAVGVTFNNSDGVNRQQILRKLSKIPQEQIAISLEREPDNLVDTNAVKVIANIRDNGSLTIGYINKSIAAKVATELDLGKVPYAVFGGITGERFNRLGCNISFTIIDIKKESCR